MNQESPDSQSRQQPREKTGENNPIVKDFIKVFLLPTLLNKAFLLYFGLNYSSHPDEGYGYGLVASIVFLFFTVGRFLWKYRNVEDP